MVTRKQEIEKEQEEQTQVVETSGVTGEPEIVEPANVDQTIADLRLLPHSDQLALAQTKGFDTVEAYLRSLGYDAPEDPIVEVYIPAYDANDIVIPGLGRTVKVRQSVIDNYNAQFTAQAGLALHKFKPRPEDIIR